MLFERQTEASISGKSTTKKLDEGQIVKTTATHEKTLKTCR